jgi:2-amino-4-hydroxy-6-hydroxymethyldihydropteridine diphosphokinase
LKEAYVALGANLGDREASLREALRKMAALPGVQVLRISAVYETEPVGYTDQPAFLNMAAALAADIPPEPLLSHLLKIENDMGRVRTLRWGPRTIDLDLLLYEDVVMNTDDLTLPHPRMEERAFVLVPLREIWPQDQMFPWEEKMALLQKQAGIERLGRLEDLCLAKRRK